MTKLHKGSPAPDFSLRDGENRTWRLEELKGSKVVVYFYPADDTPGCTTQACDFRDAQAEFRDAGYIVLGISPQGAASHRAFADRHRLNFPLLIDEDRSVAAAYGTDRAKPGTWRDIPLEVRRSTFVIDENGVIVEALYDVRSGGHVDMLRERLAF